MSGKRQRNQKQKQKQNHLNNNYLSSFIVVGLNPTSVTDQVEDTLLREDIQCQSSLASRAYRKGKALSKVAQQEMNLAKVGSPLALENARQNLLDMEDDE